MNIKEIIERTRRIEIRSRRAVDALTSGACRSFFKGKGVEFEEVREYTQEDDAKDIDWNVTARTGAAHIKKYAEERQLNVMILLDVSSSMSFGSGPKSKAVCAIEIASLLALSAIRNRDKAGLVLFTDSIEFFLPPKAERTHAMRMIREMIAREYPFSKTDIGSTLSSLMRLLRKRSIMFLISDMIDDHDFSKCIRISSRKHDIIAIRIFDKAEQALPLMPDAVLEDAENARTAFFPASSSAARENFSNTAEAMNSSVREICRASGVDLIEVECSQDFIKPLMKFFSMRQSRR